MRYIKNQLICFVIFVLMATVFLRADMGSVHAEGPSISLAIQVADRTSTLETPQIMVEPEKAFAVISYEGLTPDHDYALRLTRAMFETPYRRWTGSRDITVHTEAGGSGQWKIDLKEHYSFHNQKANSRPIEQFFFSVSLTDNDDSDFSLSTSCDFPDKQYSFFVADIDNTVVVNGNQWAGDKQSVKVTEAAVRAGANVSSEVKYSGLADNTDYKVVSKLVHDVGGTQTVVGEPVEQTFNSGTAEYYSESVRKPKKLMVDLGTFDDLQLGETCTVLHTITPLDGSWSLSTTGTALNQKLEVVESHDLPGRGEDVGIVSVHNYDENRQLLPGVGLKIVSATDPTKVYDEWISTGEMHQAYLPVGDYVLVETFVPDDYVLAEGVPFSLKKEQAFISGGNFTCSKTRDAAGTPINAVDIIDQDTSSVATIGYCFNADKAWPNSNDAWYARPLVFKEGEGTDEKLEEYLDGSVEVTPELRKWLASIIANGYPRNASGWRGDMTDEAFAYVTQAAIWHFTDNMNYYEYNLWHLGDDAYPCYRNMITQCTVDDADFDLYLYMPNNPQYQNIVYASFDVYTASEVHIRNTRVEESSEEPKEDDSSGGVDPDSDDADMDVQPDGSGARKKAGVDTGDAAPRYLMIFLLLSGAAVLAVSIRRKRERTQDEHAA